MTFPAEERRGVSCVGYHDLGGRPGFKMGLQTEGGRWYLYLAHLWHSGWTVLDVTDPVEPELLTHVGGPENTMTSQIQVADGLMVTSLERPRPGSGPVDEPNDPDRPYEEGAYFWDVDSDPAEPTLMGHYETGGGGTHRNFYNGGRFAYLTAKPPEFDGSVLSVVDCSNPAEPEAVTRWWWPGQGPGEPNGLRERSDFPRDIHYFHGPAFVWDDRAYLSYGQVGMVVLDVSDPTDPRFRYRLDLGDLGSLINTHSAIPIPDTGFVAVNTEAISESHPLEGNAQLNPLFLVDVSDEAQPGFDASDGSRRGPKVLSALPLPTPERSQPFSNYYEKPGRFGPHNQHHYRPGNENRLRSEELLFVTYFNAGLRVFDVSDPVAPTEVGYFVPEDPTERIGTRPSSDLVTHFEDVLVDSRGYIYCTDSNHGLFVLESDLLN